MTPTDFYTPAQTIASLNRETVTASCFEVLLPEDVERICKILNSSPYVGIDVECDGFSPYRGGLHGIGFSNGHNGNYYIKVNDDTIRGIAEIVETLSFSVVWVGHNLKFDMKWLELYGIRLSKFEDSYLASYVADPTAKHKLSALAGEYLNRYPADFAELVSKFSDVTLISKKGGYYKEEHCQCQDCRGTGNVRGKVRVKENKHWKILEDEGNWLWVEKDGEGLGKEAVLWLEVFKGKKCGMCKGEGHKTTEVKVNPLDFLPLQDIGDYCAEDCYESVRLWYLLNSALQRNDLYPIYELERNLMPVLLKMEQQGVTIDQEKLQEVKSVLQQGVDFWVSEFNLYAPDGNPASPSQVSQTFKALGVDIESTDKAALKRIDHPLADIVLEYRKASKLLQFADELDKPVVTTNYGFTKTGRLSSSDPNLQNIPARTEEGTLIRKCFVPHTKGNKIIALDYSAFEYRIIAYFSQDPLLLECFDKGEDFHGKLAALIFGDNYTKAQRTFVKSLNYGLAYGMGANKLSRMMSCSLEEAEDLMLQHRELVPNIWGFLHNSRESAILNGYTKTLWGRKRYYCLTSPILRKLEDNVPYSYLEYLLAERKVNFDDMKLLREAMNHPIQGTNADAIKAAKVKVYDEICKLYDTKLLLTVHDELVLEVPESKADMVYTKTKEIMENIIDLGEVPVVVDGSIADSWGDAK